MDRPQIARFRNIHGLPVWGNLVALRPLSTIPDHFASGWDGSAAAFLCLNSKLPAQPRQLRMFALIDSRARAVHRRAGVSTAQNQHGICSWDTLPDFCLIAICRRTAYDWRGAIGRPLDSRIKGQGAPRSIFRQCRSLSQFFWHLRTLQESGFSFALKRSAQCVAETDLAWRC